jgi:hypothetical protein
VDLRSSLADSELSMAQQDLFGIVYVNRDTGTSGLKQQADTVQGLFAQEA